jgi:hypothetical protein
MKPKEIPNLYDALKVDVIADLMPKWEEIPKEFKEDNTKWDKFFTDMFFFGVKVSKYVPKPDIIIKTAMRHISCIAHSREPQHEYKQAAIAFLLSEWFEDIVWEKVPLNKIGT